MHLPISVSFIKFVMFTVSTETTETAKLTSVPFMPARFSGQTIKFDEKLFKPSVESRYLQTI